MNNDLTRDILGYMDDKANRYAIALEGEWGSGKTRYCENELEDALYKENYLTYRVSMYGLSSVDELYERLAMAMVRLDVGETDSRLQKLLKGAATTVGNASISLGKALLEKYNISLNATPQMLTNMLGANQLVILDDFERQRLSDEVGVCLFGAINNLVEGLGCKVLIVTNDYQAIDAELREKTVWRCYRFDPKPEELARDIILPQLPDGLSKTGFDARESIERAAAMVGCHNARAMLKARNLIGMAISSDVMADENIDVGNREKAFVEFVRYVLLTAMGTAPKKPLAKSLDKSDDLERIQKQYSYNQYVQLGVIADYFNPKKIVGSADVCECLRTYVLVYYAGSPATMSLVQVLERTSDFQAMDDPEVEKVAKDLSRRLRVGGFDLAYLNDALQVNETLRGWGFEDALDEEEALEIAKSMVDNDIEQAYDKVYGLYRVWEDEWSSRYHYVGELCRYIVERYERNRQESSKLLAEGNPELAGKQMVEAILESLPSGYRRYLDFEPTYVVECFVRGSSSSQYAIYDLARSVDRWFAFYHNDESRVWLQKLRDELSKAEPASRMGKVRCRWTVDELEKMLKLIGQDTDD